MTGTESMLETGAVSADSHAARMRRPALTKIIATVGPASDSVQVLTRLIEAGVSIFRLNFSHGDREAHTARLAAIREAAIEAHRPIAVLGDLPGPKIRVDSVLGEVADATTGSTVVIHRHTLPAGSDSGALHITSRYAGLVDDVQVGHRVLIADGMIRMLAIEKHGESLVCSVTAGGLISSGKGINLPDSNVTVGAFTERDAEFVDWAVENDIDHLAVSFVRSADDIRQVRDAVESAKLRHGLQNLRMPIIAKIELPSAVAQIEEILRETDAIMVARGDLGVEIDIARVPIVQKRLITTARAHAKPCIVATQMLESMISAPTPTRAEATDVANAIFDGADAVMLSGETAVGSHPVLAVEYMHRIAVETEAHLANEGQSLDAPWRPLESRNRTACLAHGVWTVANDLGARFIVVWSQQGGGARYLSQYDFHVPIIAVSSDDRALRQMQLLRGVIPIRMPLPDDLAHFTRLVDQYLTATGWAEPGDSCILVAGGPIGRRGVTNSLAIHCVGDETGGYVAHQQ